MAFIFKKLGSGGGGIIDVTELPAEGKVDILYRMTESVETPSQVYLVANGLKFTLTEYFGLQGISANIQVYVVSDLPTSMVPMDEATFTVPIYILEDTGIGFVSQDGTPEGAVPLGTMIGGEDSFNKGWTDDIDSIDATNEANYGVYSVRGENKSIHTFYMYVDGKWSEYQDLANVDRIIDVDELPTENINEDAIYRKPTAGALLYFVLEGKVFTFEQLLTAFGGSGKLHYLIVDELPKNGLTSGENFGFVYILSSTGVAYQTEDDGSTYTEVSLSSNHEVYGWVYTPPTAISPAGTYTLRTTVYEYFRFKNGIFVKLSSEDFLTDMRIASEKANKKRFNGMVSRSIGEEIVLDEDVTFIGSHAFHGCGYLKTVTLPESISDIYQYAFSNSGLTNITIPSSCATIHEEAFSYCSTLRIVTFKGTPSGIIRENAFSNCNNLTNIYVPWAEGAVENAPWGATYATIHYNSTT